MEKVADILQTPGSSEGGREGGRRKEYRAIRCVFVMRTKLVSHDSLMIAPSDILMQQ